MSRRAVPTVNSQIQVCWESEDDFGVITSEWFKAKVLSSISYSIPLEREIGEGSIKYEPTAAYPIAETHIVKFLLGSTLTAIHSNSTETDLTPCPWQHIRTTNDSHVVVNSGVPLTNQGTATSDIDRLITSLAQKTESSIEHIHLLQSQIKNVLSHIHRPMYIPGEQEANQVCHYLWLLLLDELKKPVSKTPRKTKGISDNLLHIGSIQRSFVYVSAPCSFQAANALASRFTVLPKVIVKRTGTNTYVSRQTITVMFPSFSSCLASLRVKQEHLSNRVLVQHTTRLRLVGTFLYHKDDQSKPGYILPGMSCNSANYDSYYTRHEISSCLADRYTAALQVSNTSYDRSSARFESKFSPVTLYSPGENIPDVNSNEVVYDAIRLEWTPYAAVGKVFPQAITGSDDMLGDLELSLPPVATANPAVTVEIAKLLTNKVISAVLRFRDFE